MTTERMDSESAMKQVIRECDEGERLAPGAYTMKDHIRDLQKLREVDGIELASLRAQLATAQAELARVTAERDGARASFSAVKLDKEKNVDDMRLAEIRKREEWPTSAETSAVAWPINTMDGADWNILDATGTRIAICGFDVNTKTDEFRRQSSRIAWAIVGMIRNLKSDRDTLREAHDRSIADIARLTSERDEALDDLKRTTDRLNRVLDDVRCPVCGCGDEVDAQSSECGCDSPLCSRDGSESLAAWALRHFKALASHPTPEGKP